MDDVEKIAYDEQNVFARILREELPCDKIYEDDYALAFHDINPRAKIHVLVIPKGKYLSSQDFYASASEEELVSFARAVATVCEKIGLVESGYRAISNHGADARQEVSHMHMHILAGQDLQEMLPLKLA